MKKKLLLVTGLLGFSLPSLAEECGGWQQINPQHMTIFAYHNGIGDDDMGGNNPIIDSSVSLVVRDDSIIAAGFLSMRENHDDWSTFVGSNSEEVIFDAHGCRILQLEDGTPLNGKLNVQDAGKNNHRATQYPGSRALESASCLADTDGGIGGGSDSGKLYCTYKFRPIWVKLGKFGHVEEPIVIAPTPKPKEPFERLKPLPF